MITSYYTTKLGLEPETISYKNRVEADGGEVIDLAYVDSVYKKLKSINLNTNVRHFSSAKGGLIKDVNNAISKQFSLQGTDVIQLTGSSQPIFENNEIIYDGVNDFLVAETPVEVDSTNPYSINVKLIRKSINGIFNIIGVNSNNISDWTDTGYFGTNSNKFVIVNKTDKASGKFIISNFTYSAYISYNLTLVYKTNGVYDLYVNGVLDTTWNTASNNLDRLIFRCIGRFSEGVGRYIFGSIKELSIYDKELTQSQITELNDL